MGNIFEILDKGVEALSKERDGKAGTFEKDIAALVKENGLTRESFETELIKKGITLRTIELCQMPVNISFDGEYARAVDNPLYNNKEKSGISFDQCYVVYGLLDAMPGEDIPQWVEASEVNNKNHNKELEELYEIRNKVKDIDWEKEGFKGLKRLHEDGESDLFVGWPVETLHLYKKFYEYYRTGKVKEFFEEYKKDERLVYNLEED